MANRYSSESTQRELFNVYQDGSVKMAFNNSSVVVHLMNVASALEGLKDDVLFKLMCYFSDPGVLYAVCPAKQESCERNRQ